MDEPTEGESTEAQRFHERVEFNSAQDTVRSAVRRNELSPELEQAFKLLLNQRLDASIVEVQGLLDWAVAQRLINEDSANRAISLIDKAETEKINRQNSSENLS